MLEDKINKFLAIDIGYGGGLALGDCCSDGFCCAYTYDGICGYGDSDNYSRGFGQGYGSEYGTGIGSGYDSNVKEINGDSVYRVDYIPTIIKSVHYNIAQGYILQSNLTLTPCYIVKDGNKFAHGNTLRDAFTSLQEKLYNDSTEEDRIAFFIRKFPEYDVKYNNRDLFAYHHVLTGSCRMGRESFMSDRGLSLDGKATVREFVELTKDAYGGDIIKKLPKAYGIKQ